MKKEENSIVDNYNSSADLIVDNIQDLELLIGLLNTKDINKNNNELMKINSRLNRIVKTLDLEKE